MIKQNAIIYKNILFIHNMFLYQRFKEKCLNQTDIKEYKIKSLKEGECLICLEPFQVDEVVTIINCNHKYHTHCIYSWFEKKQTCPLCDKSLKI